MYDDVSLRLSISSILPYDDVFYEIFVNNRSHIVDFRLYCLDKFPINSSTHMLDT